MITKIKHGNLVTLAGMIGMKGMILQLLLLMKMMMVVAWRHSQNDFQEIKKSDNNRVKMVGHFFDRFDLIRVTIEQIGG